jgi:hypothetical protein
MVFQKTAAEYICTSQIGVRSSPINGHYFLDKDQRL